MRFKALFSILIFAVTIFFLCFNISAAPAENESSWINAASSTGADLNDITYGKNLFVAVGESGTVETSENGTKWTKRVSGVGDSLKSVIYNGSIFTAVGSNGTIITSGNGAEWTKEKSGVNTQLNSIVWDGKQFIAVGKKAILVSADGKSWNQCLPESVAESGVVNGSPYTNRIVTKDIDICSVVSCGNLYTAVGNVPVAGTPVPQVPNIIELYSIDGRNWTGNIKPHKVTTISKIARNGRIYVALGSTTEHRTQLLTNEILSGGAKPEGTILTSGDGISWTRCEMIGDYRDIVSDGENFVVVGKSAIFESPDGVEWFLKWTDGVPVGAVDGYVVLNGVACGKTKCVAVGNNGIILHKTVAAKTAEINGSGDELAGGIQNTGIKPNTIEYTATTRTLMILLLISLLTMAGLSITLIYKISMDERRKQEKKSKSEEEKAEEKTEGEDKPEEKGNEAAGNEEKREVQESKGPESAEPSIEKPKTEESEKPNVEIKADNGGGTEAAVESDAAYGAEEKPEITGESEGSIEVEKSKAPGSEAAESEKSTEEDKIPEKEEKEGMEIENKYGDKDEPVKWTPKALEEKKENEEAETKTEEPAEIKAEEPAEVKTEEPTETKAEEPAEVKAEEPAEVKTKEPAEEKDVNESEPSKTVIEEIGLEAPEIILEENWGNDSMDVNDKENAEEQRE